MAEKAPRKIARKKTLQNIDSFKLGIVANGYNWADIAEILPQLVAAKAAHGNKVIFYIFGYVDSEESAVALEGLECYVVKPVSIIHWLKCLEQCKLNGMIIPMRKILFNATSENLNKFLESGLLGVPVIAPQMPPYSDVIVDQNNGFLYSSLDHLGKVIDLVVTDPVLCANIGLNATAYVTKEFGHSEATQKFYYEAFI